MKRHHCTKLIYILLLTRVLAISAIGNTLPGYHIFKYKDNTPYSDKSIHLFSHGIASGHYEGERYARHLKIGAFYSFDYPDAAESKQHLFNFTQTSLCQKNEIKALNAAHHITSVMLDQHHNYILFGVSRGASTILTWLSKQDTATISSIDAIILESPFDDMWTITTSMCAQYIKSIRSFLSYLFRYILLPLIFRCHNPYDESPNTAASQLPTRDLPILIITSKEDSRVPWHSSAKLYCTLKENGHRNVYLLTLLHGKHAHLIDSQELARYRNTICAFYYRYHIQTDLKAAQKGKDSLLECQPLCSTIKKEIASWEPQ